ncbi:hypothetical protein [Microbulbifer sp. 2205BS26-8]|uniref:hypothetical protein n=1 Tax=Microbulbifer sp. 2205BS26-8 TaxID=3064386 RepID=UPI00273DAADA|nr:hypothetical protein [Microbulbifer sp. 2205BS26-8]MDP5209998.1 hypothetical protein [Microbulbifer sp. 2205BS26-8]
MSDSIIIDKSRFERRMQRLARDSPKVAANALNYLAFDTRENMQREMESIFDRPAPFTLRGVLVERASAQNLQAKVFLRDEAFKGIPPAKYLQGQIHGGGRRHKRFERALQRIGLLPSGMYAVPSKHAPLDKNGNFPRGELIRMLSQLRAFGEQGYRANATAKSLARRWRGSKKKRGSQYFVLQQQRGKLPPGIYLRKNYGNDSSIAHLQMGAAKPMFIFVKAPSYRARFPFRKIAARVARDNIQKGFANAVKRELRKR